MDLKNFQFNKICHFANHPYLCKGLKMNILKFILLGILAFSFQALLLKRLKLLMMSMLWLEI
ncbi:MAG: hypothetical protein H0A76_11660 [Candidatus Thiodubiliella endoseptemdiera]|uniref:Uncharacterized protein n=1 Tax=Candidatus Thiodubiliella endoseptemdiera TaxID=2738886 RepID=A0A853F479_9GAMM|nr:hypothetical protein [Candidatus Thiodubiliella endoseptemdiera]